MKYCTKCGHELDQQTGLCPNCVQRRQKYCVKCGSVLDSKSGLCLNCEKEADCQEKKISQSSIDQIGKENPLKNAKTNKTIVIIITAILLVIIGAGGFWVYSDKKNTAECSPDSVIKVVDANGDPYPSFSIEIEGLDKTFVGDDKGINVNSLGLDEGKYTVIVTEIDDEEVHIAKKINVTNKKNYSTDSNSKEENASDEVLIATKEVMKEESKYASIIEKHIRAITERWGQKKFNEELGYLGGYFCEQYIISKYTPEDFGYAVYDIDQDGRKELFIGNTKHNSSSGSWVDGYIYALYSINDDGAVELLAYSEYRDSYNLCKDNVIRRHSSGGATHNETSFYSITNSKKEHLETIAIEDEDYLYSKDTDNHWNYPEQFSKITKNKWEEIYNAHPEENYPCELIPLSDYKQNRRNAYLNVLTQYKDSIIALTVTDKYGSTYITDKNGSPSDLTVAFCDLNNDGVDEMIFVEGSKAASETIPHAAIPHVYTYENGKAVEMTIDDSGIQGLKRNNNGKLFSSVNAASATNTHYLVCLGTDGNIYVGEGMHDDMNYNYIHTYQASDNKLTLIKEAAHLKEPSYSGGAESYYINGQQVDNTQGADAFEQLNDIYKNTILYNGNMTNFTVMQKVNGDTNLSMSYDDAIAYLSK